MRENTLTTNQFVLAATMAALLCAPPAMAAKKKAPAKTDPQTQALLSEGLGSLGRGEHSAAISAFNKAARRKGSVTSYFLLGWAHYQRGFKLGSVEAADRDDAQSAVDAFSMALALDPSLKELPDASRLHFALAMCHEATQSYDKALASYKDALRAAPGKSLIAVHAARLRLKMGDKAKAVSNIELAMDKAAKTGQGALLRKAVIRDPAFAPVVAEAATRRALGVAAPEADGEMVADLGLRGEEMRDAVRDTAPKPVAPAQDPAVLSKIAEGNVEFKFRRWQSAIGAYHEALAMDQERMTLGAAQVSMIYEQIGAAYNKLGRSDTAIRSLQKALQQNPMNPSAHYQIALAYGQAGKTAAALNALRESLAACAGGSDLRRFVMSAKTDYELTAVRDLPGYAALMSEHAGRVALR